MKILLSLTLRGQIGEGTLNCGWQSLISLRLHVTYRRQIPAVEVCSFILSCWIALLMTTVSHFQIEILPAGETGPRHLDTSTVMKMQNIPFLTVSEFIRAKLNSWVMYVPIIHIYEAADTLYPKTRFGEGRSRHFICAHPILEPCRHQPHYWTRYEPLRCAQRSRSTRLGVFKKEVRDVKKFPFLTWATLSFRFTPGQVTI